MKKILLLALLCSTHLQATQPVIRVANKGELAPKTAYKQYLAQKAAEQEEVFVDMRKQIAELDRRDKMMGKLTKTDKNYVPFKGIKGDYDLSFWKAKRKDILRRFNDSSPELRMHIVRFYTSLEMDRGERQMKVDQKSGVVMTRYGALREKLLADLKEVGLDRILLEKKGK